MFLVCLAYSACMLTSQVMLKLPVEEINLRSAASACHSRLLWICIWFVTTTTLVPAADLPISHSSAAGRPTILYVLLSSFVNSSNWLQYISSSFFFKVAAGLFRRKVAAGMLRGEVTSPWSYSEVAANDRGRPVFFGKGRSMRRKVQALCRYVLSPLVPQSD